MKHLSPLGFVVVSLLLLLATPATRGADVPKPVTVMVQFTSAQGKVYSTTASKITGEQIQMPLSISETHMWIVKIIKNPEDDTLYVSVATPGKTDATQASEVLTIFEAEVLAESGKPVTALKTDQYKLEVTLTPE